MALIPTAEAADRLGVKRETLYAYVSRGQLTRHPGKGERGSLFDAAEVDALAARARRGGRAGALDIVVASAITSLNGDVLRYRGVEATALAETATFEAVAEFLWSGDAAELDRRARWPVVAVPAAFASDADPVNRFRAAIAAIAAGDELRYDLGPRAVAAAGRCAIAAMAASLPRVAPEAPTLPPTPAGPEAPAIAARLWAGLTPLPPGAAHIAALDAALVLVADHELAVSTLAARVAASARADPYSVVSTGLGVLAGSLHGGAGREVVALLEEVGEPGRAGRVVGERLRAGARIPGLGHAVYRERDPRADHLLPRVAALALLPGRWQVVEAVLAIVEERLEVLVNIDFALGALAFAAGMRRDASEAIFGVARAAGWLAHALEEYGEAPLRFRARAAYTGPR
ncbi:MAG TPA: citrate/2-methylcitrate synthase [Acidimicrobiales bacterium]|nr:citrate/2-methylcitrate synthase [Acidimicrobiales bacterium]